MPGIGHPQVPPIFQQVRLIKHLRTVAGTTSGRKKTKSDTRFALEIYNDQVPKKIIHRPELIAVLVGTKKGALKLISKTKINNAVTAFGITNPACIHETVPQVKPITISEGNVRPELHLPGETLG